MKMRMSFVRFELLSRKVSLKLPTCHIGQQDGEEDHHGEKGGDRDVQRIPAARGHLQAGKHNRIFKNMENHTCETVNEPFGLFLSTSEKAGLVIGNKCNHIDTGLLY